MNILLLNPRLKTWSPSVYVPLGLAYIAAVLEQEGHTVGITDLNLAKAGDAGLPQRLEKADIVGITGMITEQDEIVRLCHAVKEARNDARLVLGGPLASTFPRELLAGTPTDFIVVGEGERTTVALIAALAGNGGFADIKGLAYKDGDEIRVNPPVDPIADPDSIPFPARHLLDMDRYITDYFKSFGIRPEGFGKIRSTNLISSRGCPYSCTFCFKELWGNRWRGRSPENIIAEIEQLQRDYSINGFFFNDDTFVISEKRVTDFCELLQERGLKLAWYCNGRVNLMTEKMLQAMYAAGCRGIAYGIESGNQGILDSMKKAITLDQVRQVVGWTKAAGINTTGYFMIGMLGETRQTIRETLDFARELDLDFYGFSLTTPLAGTQLHRSAVEAGFIPVDGSATREWSAHINANLTGDCTDADLKSFENLAFKEFYIRKRFGRYYFLNPALWRDELKLLASIRNTEQLREIAAKTWGVLASYLRHRSR